jgi:hypothetical protein
MSHSAEYCREPQRRQTIRTSGSNGIDTIEVSSDRQTLTVFFLNRLTIAIAPANVVISGGGRVRDIKVTDIRLHAADEPDGDASMEVAIDRPGDTSTYRLSLVALDDDGEPTSDPMPGIDPRYAGADFGFQFGEPTHIDCRQPQVCPPDVLPTPDINYLARDYESFRQLMLDRLAVTVPDWQEQHVPDTGVALVEILAYVADHLSYYQDAVATEAYLATARQRISVRRHVRLVDYPMHEGCNARTWIFVNTDADVLIDPDTTHFVAGYNGGGAVDESVLSPDDISLEMRGQLVVFEPMAAVRLHVAHNCIYFYTWGDRQCCLPAGATSATLRDAWSSQASGASEAKPQTPEKRSSRKRPAKTAEDKSATYKPATDDRGAQATPPAGERALCLKPGDVLLFEEVKGRDSNAPDPALRHLVRLTEVKPNYDPLFDQPVVDIAWAVEDALPFSLCLCEADGKSNVDISVARGNMVLADHGNWTGQGSSIKDEQLPKPMGGKKYRPTLKTAPLTFGQLATHPVAAAAQLRTDPRAAVPQIYLTSIPAVDGGMPLFTFADLEDPAALTSRIASGQDLASRTLRDRLATAPAAPPTSSSADANARTRQTLQSMLRTWTPCRDLLSSNGNALHFVVEMDDQGLAHLRFGDGQNGQAPELGEQFTATYRVGIGVAGNVGAETVTHVVTTQGGLRPRNPLAATGGTDPEPIARVKLLAPKAYQGELVRAISADDYARLAERNARVQRAACALQWAGTRYEAHVAIDPLGTDAIDHALLRQVQAELYRYRRIGHDVLVVPPTYVPLDIALTVQVLPGYARGHLETLLRNIFSDHRLADGTLGFFHPDNLTFGESVYASRLIAAAQNVDGVESVVVTRLQRRFEAPNRELDNGVLPIGPLEVARLGSNRANPENGRFVLTVRGGQ